MSDISSMSDGADNHRPNVEASSATVKRVRQEVMKDEGGQYLYTGTLNDQGVPHGQGYKTMTGIGVYEGSFKNGQFQGDGSLDFESGSRYVGTFVRGQAQGEGIFLYANGDKYVSAYEDELQFALRIPVYSLVAYR